MKDVLHRVQHDGLRLTCQVEQALHPQQCGATGGHHHLQPGGKALHRKRRVIGQAEGLDMGVMAVPIMRVRVMAMMMTMTMARSMVMIRNLGPSLGIQPGCHLRRLGRGIIRACGRQNVAASLAQHDPPNRRARVQPLEAEFQ